MRSGFPSILAGAGALLLVLSLCLNASPAQEQQYREREVLDPQSDDWRPEPLPPPTSAPSDELGEARALLARGEPRAARRMLKKWVKANSDHPRYWEGVFLLAEAEFQRRDYWAAYKQFSAVAENSAGELFHLAIRRQVDVARAFLSGQKRIVWRILRLPAYDDGVEILDRVWQNVPGTRIGEDALRFKADYFFSRAEMDLAQDEYVALAREYPSGRFVQMAMFRAGEAARASFIGIKYDAKPLAEAEERFRQLAAAFPQYAERNQVPAILEGIRQSRAGKDLDIARWYARTQRQDAAQYYYQSVLKRYPDTAAAAEARVELRRMGVETEDEKGP